MELKLFPLVFWMQWKGGGQDGYGKERGSGTEKKRTAVVLSPGNEAERIYPACCNQIREVRVSDTRLMGKRRYASRYAFFLAQKPGRYSFSGLVHGRE